MNLGKNIRKSPCGGWVCHLYSLSFSTFAIFSLAEEETKRNPSINRDIRNILEIISKVELSCLILRNSRPKEEKTIIKPAKKTISSLHCVAHHDKIIKLFSKTEPIFHSEWGLKRVIRRNENGKLRKEESARCALQKIMKQKAFKGKKKQKLSIWRHAMQSQNSIKYQSVGGMLLVPLYGRPCYHRTIPYHA